MESSYDSLSRRQPDILGSVSSTSGPGAGHQQVAPLRRQLARARKPDVSEVRRKVRNLVCYRNIFADQIGAAWLETLDLFGTDRPQEVLVAYSRLFGLLADEAAFYPEPLVGDAWQNHLLDRILADDNPFSRKARLTRGENLDTSLLAASRQDLGVLQTAHSLSGELLAGQIALTLHRDQTSESELVTWTELRGLNSQLANPITERQRLKAVLGTSIDWRSHVGDLVSYYSSVGTGLFGQYRAFRWIHRSGSGSLQPIAYVDPITLDELVGYDSERALLLRNTEHFLAGYPANNVLIYGDRGTGKSSTIKAILNAGADRGLRLIEVSKQHLEDFPEILSHLRGRPERFILFVDDLSFGDQETRYKELKAVLEGGLEARLENVVLYATSNRRHLVQERFSDRIDPGDEIHRQDAVQEKLSLSDRFGITIIFQAPDQDRYLAIVRALAERRGLQLPDAELSRRALEWAAWHNGRSGRSARQFIDYLFGELNTGHVAPLEDDQVVP